MSFAFKYLLRINVLKLYCYIDLMAQGLEVHNVRSVCFYLYINGRVEWWLFLLVDLLSILISVMFWKYWYNQLSRSCLLQQLPYTILCDLQDFHHDSSVNLNALCLLLIGFQWILNSGNWKNIRTIADIGLKAWEKNGLSTWQETVSK